MPDPESPSDRGGWLRAVEVLCSAAAAILVLTFPIYSAGVSWCLEGCVEPHPDEIRDYRRLLGLFAALVLTTLVLARCRRAAWRTFAWHAAVAIAGAASAVVFSVPEIDFAELLREDPQPYRSENPCHSGSNECTGG